MEDIEDKTDVGIDMEAISAHLDSQSKPEEKSDDSVPDNDSESTEIVDDKSQQSPDVDEEASEQSGSDDSTTTEEATSSLPEDIVNKANGLGFPIDRLEAFGDDAGVALKMFEDQVRQENKNILDAAGKDTDKPKDTQDGEPTGEVDKSIFGLDEEAMETLEPEVREAFTKAHEQNQQLIQQNQQIMAALDGMAEQSQESQEQQVVSWLDGKIGSLDEHQRKVFGEGPSASLNADSPEWKARNQILQDAKALFSGRADQGNPISEDEAFNRALMMMSFESVEKTATDKVRGQVKSRSNQILEKPDGNKSDKDFGLKESFDQAVENVAEIMARATD